MKTERTWQGVRLRQIEAGAEPDSPTRPVRIPVCWEDSAASAVCSLAREPGRVSLPALARSWIAPLASRAREAGLPEMGERLHALLLHRQGAPSPGIWRGEAEAAPGFVLNLPMFHDPMAGFDVDAFNAAIDTAATALLLLTPDAPRFEVAIADLAGLLAALGLDYAGQPARDVAACLAGLLRGRVDTMLAGRQMDLLACVPDWPAPPLHCVVPGLAQAAAAARIAALRCGGARPGTAIVTPGPVDALLGVETGGIAPAFSPVSAHGLAWHTVAWLEARGIGLDAALASALAGEPVIPAASVADHAAMHDAVAPMLHAMPPRPVPMSAASAIARREELPARRRGFTQKAAVGGHRVFLRTGDYPDGRLGEIGLALPRESAAVRGLADALAAAISIGLQHGAPLEAFVDGLAHQRFAPSGAVEGDPAVDRASSIPDYVVRSLAASYLGRVIPAGDVELPAAPEEPPLLPLDLPRRRARAALRLVAG